MDWFADLCLHGTRGLGPLRHFEEGELLFQAAPEARLGLPAESVEEGTPGTEEGLPSNGRAPPSTPSCGPGPSQGTSAGPSHLTFP